ncbi:putative immunity protein [Deinococcus marmoris]|uniref:putative immunity protein n=1 Tax=Deinococcus marmoris TaxID=249408 RepID=UPI003CCBE27B
MLACFEAHRPDDDRPRKAVEAARAWARGDLRMVEARAAAFACHAAAREASDPAAIAAARAAGHAAATAHVATHAPHAARYARAAAAAEDAEREWQRQQLPERLWAFAFG